MSQTYYRELRDYIEALEQAGKLVRVKTPVNKDTELHPLVRLQFLGLEEEERKAFLFENVYDSKGKQYAMPVILCAMAGSRQIYGLGLQCAPEDIPKRWAAARQNPIPPITVEQAPVQEVVIQGEELRKQGLSRLPVPISTPGFDNAPYTSSTHWISKDPDTGVHNVGNYRGMIKSETRIGCFCGASAQGLRQHVNKWKQKGAKTMPAAAVIGTPPSVSYTAVTRLPYEVCEYDIAGGLAGVPLELVKCKTVDLLVPAQAEIVIEGNISLEELEMEGPFGEFPGYMAQRDYSYFMEVTCITMRKKPIYQAFLSQLAPSESSKLRQMGWENIIRRKLLEEGMSNILDVHAVEASGSWGVIIVKIRREHENDGKRVLDFTLEAMKTGKMIIVVDEDIDIRDPSAVYWALAFNMQPHRDVSIAETGWMPLDPSLFNPHSGRGNLSSENEIKRTALLIDATRDWPYPPVSLPKKEYMEKAIGLWEKLNLPILKLKKPWYGYPLGYWTEEDAAEAELATQGRYYETAEKHRLNFRKPF